MNRHITGLHLLLVWCNYPSNGYCSMFGIAAIEQGADFIGEVTNAWLDSHISAYLEDNEITDDFCNPFTRKSSGSFGCCSYSEQWPLGSVTFKHPIQSPVDIITCHAVDKDLPELCFVMCHMQGKQVKVMNSGHTVYIYPAPNCTRPYLRGGPCRGCYLFEQMHVHWGKDNDWGSEHFVNGESHAAEAHLVFYNCKYGSFECAAEMPDGLAVIAVFAEECPEGNCLMDPLYDILDDIITAGDYVMLDCRAAFQWVLSAFDVNCHYCTCPGSLTTEPYTENVIWMVFPEPITVCGKQMSAFRSLHSESGCCITENKRQLQPMFKRPLLRCSRFRLCQ